MQRRRFLRILICTSSAAAVTSGTGGCGLILHPGRKSAPHSNQIDWKVAALDGLGLILFFVPGVVAFAVDFYTGAIYLPANNGQVGYTASKFELKRRDIPREDLKMSSIEKAVSDHIGENVSLRDDSSRVSHLAKIDQFGTQVEHHQRDNAFGHKLLSYFTPWKDHLGIET